MGRPARATQPIGPSIIDVMENDALLASSFQPTESWERWKVALSAAFGLPPPKCKGVNPVAFYREHTGRSQWPTRPAAECWFAVGVRGGKSAVSALVAVYLACFRDYKEFLSPGEYGTVMVMAGDRRQARVVFGYIRAMLGDNPVFARLIKGETAESITLSNRVRIEVHTASYKSIRGYTVLAAVLDEIAVWQSDGSNPDAEVVTAVRSRFATIPNAMLVAISSPYARSGELWETYDRHFGDKGSSDMFVWQAATRDMNPSVSEAHVARQYERDVQKARAEYGGEFRTDVERYVPLEVVRRCTVDKRTHLPPMVNVTYRAFVDPSGGRSDAMVLAIAHASPKGQNVIIDVLKSFKAPFVPSKAIASLVAILKEYSCHRVHGDRYGGEWPREGFRAAGIDYQLHAKSKSDLYVDLLPRLFSETIEMLDIPEIGQELVSLERRVSPSGRELIDHPMHGHDDHANAVAGVADLLSRTVSLRPVW
jgi:hypothetical protein